MNRFHCGLIELKFAPADTAANDMTFEGYGAVFGNVDAYGDVMEPGAFASYLSDMRIGKQQWPAMLLQHGGWGASADDMTPIGVWTELSEDGRGLKVKGQLADTPRGREIYTLMKMAPRPAIDGLSIGYIPKEFEMRSKPEDPRRRLKRVDLIEISPVTFPANTSARVAAVKSTSGLTIRDAERALRDAGYSRSEAKAVLANGYRSIDDVRDADDELTTLAATIQRNIATLTGVTQ